MAATSVGTVDADLFASGNRSTGLLAQSIGGGGGAGGINVSGGIEATKTGKEASVVFGVGGFGGAGNTAGDVTITQKGQVMVDGANAYGVLVQSVGGGGGVGGLNVAASVNTGTGPAKTDGLAIAGGLGGKGGTGADAGDVSLTSNGNVFVNTEIAQDPDGNVTFSGVEFADSAPGVVAQSIGGGGGAGGMNITAAIAPKGSPIAIGIGGTGGVGGDAGDVTVVRGYGDDGDTATPRIITTFGDGSTGLAAQSIGGGGGNAGMNFVFAATLQGEDSDNVAGIFAVGGDGSAAGNGADVNVRHNGDILTDGDASGGLLAQSIAGGGGNANFNIGLGLVRNATALTVAVGGGTGDGGTAGNVTVDHIGYIETQGDQSNGITAQSLAGGGGNAAMSMAPALLAKNKLQIGIGREGGTGGIAGNVLVTADDTIITHGNRFARASSPSRPAARAVPAGPTRSPDRAAAAPATMPRASRLLRGRSRRRRRRQVGNRHRRQPCRHQHRRRPLARHRGAVDRRRRRHGRRRHQHHLPGRGRARHCRSAAPAAPARSPTRSPSPTTR